MEPNYEETYDCLISWMCSLLPASSTSTTEEVSTGKPMAEALMSLDPERFNDDWFSKTCSSVEEASNWRVKAITLKKILKSMDLYFSELTGHAVPKDCVPDLQTAARDCSKAELSKMLQIMVVIAVNCPNRSAVIANISQFDEDVQRCVMTTIELLEGSHGPSKVQPTTSGGPDVAELEHQLKEALKEIENLKESNDELNKRCVELENQVSVLHEEKRVLSNDKLQLEKRQKSDSETEPLASEKKVQTLQKQLDEMQDEIYRLESSREESKNQTEILQKENKELKERVENFAADEIEFRKMKDEVDELRVRAAEAKKFESSLEMYKRKLDELGHLRSELKILEDKNSAYMKCAIDLEEEQRKNGALKTQLEAYKRQLQEIDAKLMEEVKRADKATFEAQMFQDKMQAAMLERDRLAAERDSLKDLRDELHLLQFAATPSGDETNDDAKIGGSTPELKSELQHDLKERLKLLEHENKLLKVSRVACQDEKMELLQSQYDDVCRRKQELETDLRLANLKINELNSKFADMQNADVASDKTDQNRMQELHRQAELQSLEAQKANQRLFDTEKMLNERDQKIKSLEGTLQTKENELKSQEAKYKSYLDKARTVIVALEGNNGSNVGTGYSRQEFDALKRELQEKEKFIQRMQEEQERMRIMKEQEERLITTAFHGMSMQMHRNASENRLATMAGQLPTSFLSRQRQITSKKSSTNTSNSQQNTNYR